MKLPRAAGLCSAPLQGSHQFSRTPLSYLYVHLLTFICGTTVPRKAQTLPQTEYTTLMAAAPEGLRTKLFHSKTWLPPLFLPSRARAAAPSAGRGAGLDKASLSNGLKPCCTLGLTSASLYGFSFCSLGNQKAFGSPQG